MTKPGQETLRIDFYCKQLSRVTMVSWSKTLALMLAMLFLTSFVMVQPAPVKAQTDNTVAPALAWQQEYGVYQTESVSNLIQTNDGGYAFLDLGWSHGFTLTPSTLYKTDSLGNVQWTKTIDWFTAISVIQTSDKGFEVSGKWNTYGTPFETNPTPTLIKTDSAGNIRWVQNYTIEPPNLKIPSSKIFANDGGIISLQSSGSIIKIDSNGTIQWKISGAFTYYNFKTPPIQLSSLIETSDRSIAALGVGTPYSRPMWQGNIYLVKTEAFLPLLSPTPLLTPISTPTSAIFLITAKTLPIIAIAAILAVITVSLLIFGRHRKTTK